MGYQDYIDSVQSGQRITGSLERLAVQRHLDMLQNPAYVFDLETVSDINLLFRHLRHTSGDYYGLPFNLLPWQEFVLASLFGWHRKDNGKRLFRKAYIEVAKKNGKSELAGSIGLYGTFFDGEAGAECYSAANKYDQATICWNAGKVMATQLMSEDRSFASVCKVYDSITTRGLKNLTNESSFKPIAADAKTLDGVRPHIAIIDEYHEAKDDSILRNLSSGMVNRSQPLLLIITTAGFNINGACYRYRKVITDILEGKKHDDTTFGLIFTPDEGDDWRNEKTWHKANPSLGHTPTLEGLQSEFQKALNEGQSAEINFKTKNLNIWVRQSKAWVQDHVWMQAVKPIDPAALLGRECYGAFDLSSTRDITCFGLLFSPAEEGEQFTFLSWYFCPEDNANIRAKRDGVPYMDWAKNERLILTSGNSVDQDFVKAKILEACANYSVKALYYDPWQSAKLATELMGDGATVQEFRQTPVNYNEPIKTLEVWLSQGRLNHGGDEVLRWMCGNVEIMTNHTGLQKFTKSGESNKIDGMVVLAMCVAAYLNDTGKTVESAYNNPENELFFI